MALTRRQLIELRAPYSAAASALLFALRYEEKNAVNTRFEWYVRGTGGCVLSRHTTYSLALKAAEKAGLPPSAVVKLKYSRA